MKEQKISVADLYTLSPKIWWTFFKSESFAFKMICCYLFVEYVRPQSIIPALDFLPWAKLFVLGALFGLLLEKEKKWVSSSINRWMILFFLCILWSSITAYEPSVAYTNLANFYTWLIIYFLIVNIVNTPQRFVFFLAIFCVASFKISFSLALVWAKRGFSFSSWGLSGPAGFFQNSGELAIQMSVFWPIALAVALTLKPHVPLWKFRVLMLMPVTACMVILGASSRGGQLAMLIQFAVRFAKSVFKFKVLLSILVIASLSWSFLPDEQKQRFSESGEDRTSLQRFEYWKAGWEMINDYPMTGVGYFNFPRYFEDYYPDKLFFKGAELAHNIFVQVGADLGYPGLLCYSLLIIGLFRLMNRSKKMMLGDDFKYFPQAISVSFMGFIVAGQFVSVVYYPFMWIQLALAVSFTNAIAVSKTQHG